MCVFIIKLSLVDFNILDPPKMNSLVFKIWCWYYWVIYLCISIAFSMVYHYKQTLCITASKYMPKLGPSCFGYVGIPTGKLQVNIHSEIEYVINRTTIISQILNV